MEIVANVFLKFSDGFRRKIFGLLSLAAVLAAFNATRTDGSSVEEVLIARDAAGQ